MANKRLNSLLDFGFKKVKRTDVAASCADNNTNYENEKDVNDPHVILPSSNNIDNLDVGNYLSYASISDQEKFKIL